MSSSVGSIRPWTFVLCVGALVLVGACGPRAATGPGPARPVAAQPDPTEDAPATVPTIDLEPMRIEVGRSGEGEQIEIYDARELFDRASIAFDAGGFDLAIELYGRLVSEFPDSQLVAPALYNWGLALEGKGQLDQAIDQFRQAASAGKGTRHELDALIRIGAVLADKGRFAEAEAQYQALLGKGGLAASDRVELLARRGYALVEAKRYAEAEQSLSAAIAEFQSASRQAPLETDFYVAMAHYYLAEVPRRQFEAQPLRLPDSQLQQDLESKAKLALLAKQRFEETVVLVNVYWATAAIYQMGSIQKEMWRALTSAPVPTNLDAPAQKVYAEEVRKLARPHLDRALEVHAKNLEVESRYRTETDWSKKSREEIAAIARLVSQEDGAPPALPSQVAPIPGRGPGGYVPGRYDL